MEVWNILPEAGLEVREGSPDSEAAEPRSFLPEEVAEAHGFLAAAFSRGEIDRDRYLRISNAMKFVDEYGRIWSISLRSGRWYYNVDFQWFEGEPHSLLSRLESKLPVCLYCGETAPAGRARYCIACGRSLQSLPEPGSLHLDRREVKGERRAVPRILAAFLLALAALALALLLYLGRLGGLFAAAVPLAAIPAALPGCLTAATHRRSGT
jgi:hypothetical protein